MGAYLPGTGTLGWAVCYGAGLLAPEISLLNFYPPHVGEGPAHSASLLLLTGLDVCGFFNSVFVRLPFNSVFEGSG